MVPSECRARVDDIHIVIRQYPCIIDSEFVKEEPDVFHSEFLFLVVGELAFYCGHMSSLSLETCRAHISRVCCSVVCVDFLHVSVARHVVVATLRRPHVVCRSNVNTARDVKTSPCSNSIIGSCPISFMILLTCTDLTSYRTHTVCLCIP